MPAMTDDHGPRRLELSLTQLLAGAAAAASGAWFASRLGVAGTVVGAALVSSVVTVLSAVYAHGVRRTAERLAQGRPRTAAPALPAVELEDATGYRWGRMALVALAVFATAMVGITAVELATGQPLACAFDDSACTRQTTLVPGRPQRTPAAPSTPAPSGTPTPSPSPTGTPTPSPSTTPGPTASESPSGSPTGSTSGSPLPSASGTAVSPSS